MSDNITLPREVVVQAVKVLSPMAYDTWPKERNEVVETLRARLAAPSEDIEALRRDAERLKAENERLREALPYDWDQLEACRESLREHMAEINLLKAERDDAVKAEREACARMVDHIYKEGGGTYGKVIRARGQEVPK